MPRPARTASAARPARRRSAAGLALAALLGACGTGSGDINQEPPVSVAYSNPNPVYTACQTIVPNLPSVVGLVGSYTIAPPPPTGLAFDAKSGILTGTPTAPQAATAYGITAFNNVGSVATVLTIAVDAAPAPSGLAYALSPASYPIGMPIAPNVPSYTGVANLFTIAPPLPAGLFLNPATGVIAGTPMAALLETEFTVTAQNCAGAQTTTTVRIEVVDPSVPTIANLLFVANEGDDTLSVLGVNPQTGKLRSQRWERVGDAPVDLVATIDGKTLYVLHRNAGNVGAYSIQAKTGRLTQITGSPYGLPVGAAPEALALAPDGLRLYVANTGDASVSGFTIAPSGALTPIPGNPFAVTGVQPAALAVHPAGTHLYVASRGSGSLSVFGIGPTGALQDAGTLAGLDQPGSIAAFEVAPGTSVLYVGEQGPAHRVSTYALGADGQPTALVPVALSGGGGSGGPRDLVATAFGTQRVLYVANATAGEVERLALDATGQPSPPSAFAAGPYSGGAPEALATNAQRTFCFALFAGDGEASTASIAQATGDLAAIAPTDSPTDRMRVRATPGAIALVNGIAPAVHASDVVYAVTTLSALPGLGRVTSRQHLYSPDFGPPTNKFTGDTTSWVEAHPYLDYIWVANAEDSIGFDIQGFPTNAAGLVQNANFQLEIGNVVTATQGVYALHVEPSGRYLFAVRSDSPASQVIPFAINTNGTLAPGAAVTVGDTARAAAVDPTGRFLYVPNQLSGTLSQLRIDPVNGALSPIAAPVASGGEPFSAEVDPTGRFCYVADRSAGSPGIRMFRIDAATGALTPLATPALAVPGSLPSDLVLGPRGRYVYLADETSGAPLRRFELNLDPDDATDDGTLAPPPGGGETLGVGPVRAIRADAGGTRLFLVLSNSAGLLGDLQVFTVNPSAEGDAQFFGATSIEAGQGSGGRGVASRDRTF